MKRTLILLTVAITLLSSCADEYLVKLKNGSVITVKDNQDRKYRCGNTICVETTNGRDWFVDTQGMMRDTVTTFDYVRPDSTVTTVFTESRIGVIIRR